MDKENKLSLSCQIPSPDTLKILLYRYHLGDPPFHLLKNMFPSFFHNVNVDSFQCDTCEIAKESSCVISIKQYKIFYSFLFDTH